MELGVKGPIRLTLKALQNAIKDQRREILKSCEKFLVLCNLTIFYFLMLCTLITVARGIKERLSLLHLLDRANPLEIQLETSSCVHFPATNLF